MTYLELINNFWQKDLEFFFSADEVNLYFRLLKHANQLSWKPAFNLSVDRLMLEVGIKTKRPFDSARKVLRDAGLIEFINGNGRGCTTEYQIIGAETLAERGAKNDTLSAHLSDTLSATIPRRERNENVLLHKTKIKNKIKDDYSSERKEGQVEKPTSLPAANSSKGQSQNEAAPNAPAFDDFWQSYGKKVGRHKTAERWKQLTADEQAAALAHAPRYAAATPDKQFRKDPLTYLNSKCWLDEELPAPRHGQQPAPVPVPALPPLPAPELNGDFLAEQQARADAEQDAHFARYSIKAEPEPPTPPTENPSDSSPQAA
ncbi:MAG: hypothetical protein ACRYFZ_01715 [Janthinobacterium lividum]